MAVAAAARRSVDLGAHRSEQIGAERVRAADLVVVMDAFQEREIRLRFGKRRHAVLILADLLPAFGDARVIPDPIDQPLEAFERVYAQIDQCLAVLRTAMGSREAP
jgi:protein-tyrosine-phosphatase